MRGHVSTWWNRTSCQCWQNMDTWDWLEQACLKILVKHQWHVIWWYGRSAWKDKRGGGMQKHRLQGKRNTQRQAKDSKDYGLKWLRWLWQWMQLVQFHERVVISASWGDIRGYQWRLFMKLLELTNSAKVWMGLVRCNNQSTFPENLWLWFYFWLSRNFSWIDRLIAWLSRLSEQ